jgi:hypothetical protein
MRMKKFLIIFLVCVVAIVVIGIVISIIQSRSQGVPVSITNTFPVSLFYPDSPSGPVVPGGSGGQADNEEYAEEDEGVMRPVPLSGGEIYGYWLQQRATSTGMDTVFFFAKDGQLKKNDGTGEQQVGDVPYGTPVSVKQNRSGSFAAVRFDSGSVYAYSVDRRAWELVGSAVTDMAFSPDGASLLALEERGGETSLVRYEPFSAVRRVTTLLRMQAVDLRVQWPAASRVILTSVPSYFTEGSVWVVNLQSNTVARLLSGSGVDALGSQLDARLLIFRSESRSKTNAGLYSFAGVLESGYSRMLLAAKCAASLTSSAFFCGAPQLLPAGSFVFPDDYLKRKVFTHDDLISVSAEAGMLTVPYSSDSYMDMSSIAHANGAVYFINRLDGKVYKLEAGI